MQNWQYEIIIGSVEEVRQELCRMGSLGWEITSTDVLSSASNQPRLIVYLRRGMESSVPESEAVSLDAFPVLRPHT